ncbi:hypothetical protein TNCT_653601 [Trichonephila clavata]|uniref:Uncharacterized protein n=1 Tax=Trichonephila clavata TaxID=2740835 RepID=A0A8X6F8H0_TRICU|nr:hypothetical protein TNCT_653601 [Trichonephila clavata]
MRILRIDRPHAPGKRVGVANKVPYCVENFMKRLHERKITYSEESIGPRFEEEYLYPENQLEYDHYRRGSAFEDKIDFPPGQLRAEILRKILQNREKGRDILIQYVVRRFEEETGYDPCVRDQGPLAEVQFKSSDGNTYTQYYFLALGFQKQKYNFSKVDSWRDQLLIFEPRLLKVKDVIEILKCQQNTRMDLKHLLLQNPEVWKIENTVK